MTAGDGAHTDPPMLPGGPWREVLQRLERLEAHLRPVLITPERLAQRLDPPPHIRTIKRRIEKLGIPWRNMNGSVWEDGDGQKYIYIPDWELAMSHHTRIVKKDLGLRPES